MRVLQSHRDLISTTSFFFCWKGHNGFLREDRRQEVKGPQKDWLACFLSEDQASSCLSSYLSIHLLSHNFMEQSYKQGLTRAMVQDLPQGSCSIYRSKCADPTHNFTYQHASRSQVVLQHVSMVILSAEQQALAIDHVVAMRFSCSERVVFVMRGFHFVCGGSSLARCSDLAVFRHRDGNPKALCVGRLCDRSELLSGTK